jgi:hypothetical protein
MHIEHVSIYLWQIDRLHACPAGDATRPAADRLVLASTPTDETPHVVDIHVRVSVEKSDAWRCASGDD